MENVYYCKAGCQKSANVCERELRKERTRGKEEATSKAHLGDSPGPYTVQSCPHPGIFKAGPSLFPRNPLYKNSDWAKWATHFDNIG